MLPSPTSSFTIPSIYDRLPLDCRIYHPKRLASPTSDTPITSWRKKAAIIAHPYAPLGGCFDDPVVSIAGSAMLAQGFVVCTFNFRGAGGSKGHTSWSSKAEQGDYISVLAFLTYYMHFLLSNANDAFRTSQYSQSEPELRRQTSSTQALANPLYDTASGSEDSNTEAAAFREGTKTVLVLGGYSYGAMIVTSLSPIVSTLITPFQTPPPQSAHAEIRRRAQRLARQQNAVLPTRGSHYNEQDNILLATAPPDHHSNATPENEIVSAIPNLADHFQHAYLLISPIQGFVRNLASMWTFSSSTKQNTIANNSPYCDNDVKFTVDPTLAIFGDDDCFTSAMTLRAWGTALRYRETGCHRDAGTRIEHPGANFDYVEVHAAGHFWVDEVAKRVLSQSVADFAGRL